MEKQLENPTQNQSKLTSKSSPKTVQTHWKTQHKPYSTENSCEMPNGAGSAAIATARWSSIVAVGSSIAVVVLGWEAKGHQLGVGGEGSSVGGGRRRVGGGGR